MPKMPSPKKRAAKRRGEKDPKKAEGQAPARQKRSFTISDEERQRRSDRAKQLVAEGKIGGAGRGQGRKRIPRASELVAEEARKHAREITQVFKDGVKPHQNIRVRMEAANAWLAAEHKEASLQLEEDKLDDMSREELINGIVGLLNDDTVAVAFGETIDGEAEDVVGDDDSDAAVGRESRQADLDVGGSTEAVVYAAPSAFATTRQRRSAD